MIMYATIRTDWRDCRLDFKTLCMVCLIRRDLHPFLEYCSEQLRRISRSLLLLSAASQCARSFSLSDSTFAFFVVSTVSLFSGLRFPRENTQGYRSFFFQFGSKVANITAHFSFKWLTKSLELHLQLEHFFGKILPHFLSYLIPSLVIALPLTQG